MTNFLGKSYGSKKQEAKLLDRLKLQEDSLEFRKACNLLYANYKERIAGLVRKKHSLEEDDITRITHQTLASFLQNVRSGQYREEAEIFHYMASIADHIVYSFFRLKKRDKLHIESLLLQPPHNVHIETPEYIYLQKERVDQINDMLEKLGERCRELLRLWMNGDAFSDIAIHMGFKTEGVARVMKLKCLRKLEDLLPAYPDLQNW